MKKKILLIILALVATGLQAQKITGDWYGLLEVQGTQLKIIYHIEQNNEVLTSTMDSPDQNATGLPIDETTLLNNELFLNAKSMGITYRGIVNKNMDTIRGSFVQGAVELPLILTRTESEKKIISRPQDPTDYPYYKEDVVFNNAIDGIELAGTLTLPKDKKVTKIVILISGSGPQNRDEEVAAFNHRPFLVWSDWLTKQGIGVLRYDDRGVGESSGIFDDATSADFANDTEAAVKYILTRDDLENVSIGLMGHSEGGIIAPMVASRNKNIKFIVLLAGPGLPIDQLLLQQIEDIAALEKIPADVSKLNIETTKKMLDYLKEHKDTTYIGREFVKADIEAGLREILKTELEKYPEEALEGVSVDEIIQREIKTHTGNWFRFFATYDPAVALEKVTCPVLALNGTLDSQVRCTTNLDAINKALIKAKNNNFEVVQMEGLNHMMQKAMTGAVSEYGKIEETVNPVALKKVSDWINNLK